MSVLESRAARRVSDLLLVDGKRLFIKIVKNFENRKLSFFNVKSLNSMLNLKILTEKSFFSVHKE